jgi:hypothetical protein
VFIKVKKYIIEKRNIKMKNNNEMNPDKESIEDYLTRMQHNVSNCQWMVHNHSEIASFVRKVYWD